MPSRFHVVHFPIIVSPSHARCRFSTSICFFFFLLFHNYSTHIKQAVYEGSFDRELDICFQTPVLHCTEVGKLQSPYFHWHQMFARKRCKGLLLACTHIQDWCVRKTCNLIHHPVQIPWHCTSFFILQCSKLVSVQTLCFSPEFVAPPVSWHIYWALGFEHRMAKGDGS